MADLRQQTAHELERLLAQSGLDDPWSTNHDASTRWLYTLDGELYEPSRLRLHERLIEQRRQASPATTGGTLTVVITAGPPGAGKTTALAHMPELAEYRHIDADDFKDDLLRQAGADGLLRRWTDSTLVDGLPVAPRELSGFVHAESTTVADAYRRQALRARENVVVHGTLSSTEYADDLLAELDLAGYETLTIIDVEVPQQAAVDRALDRWWTVRHEHRDPMGGRFVPASAIARYFPAHQPVSVSFRNAEALRDTALELGWRAELIVMDGSQ